MKVFCVAVANTSGAGYVMNFSAENKEDAILQMGMELGDVRAINSREWTVKSVEEV